MWLTGATDGRYELDPTGHDVYAMGLIPLGIADIFAKVGVVDWSADVTTAMV